jgi:hypothetical protein
VRAVVALVLGLVMMLGTAAGAQDSGLTDQDRAQIRAIIGQQVEAFRADDEAAAFGYASPAIQRMFGTPELFMDMVRQGYQPVYRPRVFDFREIVTLDGEPAQKVHVVGPDGRPVTAYYPMIRMPDGSWRINGCFLQAPDENQA